MPHRSDHRQRQQSHRATQRLLAEAQQVGERAAPAGDDRDVDVAERRHVLQGAGYQRRCVPVLHRGEPPHQPARPATPPQPGEDVVPRLAALARDDPDRVRKQRQLQPLLRRQRPLRVQLPAQPLDAGEQIPLAGDPQVCHRKREAQGGRGAARIEVASSRHHHLRPLGRQRGARRDRLPVPQPNSARDRSALVAQLEVHPRAGGAQVDELPDQLHLRERRAASRAARWRTHRPRRARGTRSRVCPRPATARPVGLHRGPPRCPRAPSPGS